MVEEEGRPLLRRRALLRGALASVALTVGPAPRLGSAATPGVDGPATRAGAGANVSGKIVARQVDHPAPALLGLMRRGSGEIVTADAVDTGATGGGTLSVTSDVVDAGQLFERVGVHYRAARGAEDAIFIEIRASADGSRWSDWQALHVDELLTDVATNTFYIEPARVAPSSRFAQYRAWLTTGDPAQLEHVGLTFLDVSDLNLPPLARLAGGAARAVAGALRLDGGLALATVEATGASRILTRQDWGADESLMKWTPKYVPVKKAVVHHTVTDDGGTNVAAAIRAMYYFHAVTRGWGDIGYSYVVDKFGNIWTGRQGGDHTVAGHAYGWNEGSIGVACLGDYGTTAPTGALQGAMANVVALRFKQLGIAPYGSGAFTHQEQKSDGSWIDVATTVANVLGHRDCTYVVGQTGGQTACPGNALYPMLPGLRTLAQTAWQAGYTTLTRIDPQMAGGAFPGQQLTAAVTVTNLGTLAIPAGTLVNYRILRAGAQIAQGAGATLSQPIAPGGSAAVPVLFTAPPAGEYVVRWDLQTGSAWWSSVYSSPFRDVWFRAADWSANWLDDTVTRQWTAGEVRMITATVQNDGGRTWNATGIDPVRIGYYWISNATGARIDGAQKMPLPQDVIPGQTVTLTLPVLAPLYPTNYTMVLDLYKENEFWFKDKGLAPDDTPTTVSVDFKAAYQVGVPLPTFSAGKTVAVPLTITNMGRGTFPIASANPVDLGYHWYDAAGATVVWDGARTALPADLLPGQSVTVPAQVTAPTKGGAMQLRFDLVQEGVGWFSSKGVAPSSLSVTVEGPVVSLYGATYQPAAASLAQSGALAAVPITVTNTSNFTWPAGGANPIDLGYHWIAAGGPVLVWEGLRTKLPADLAPGQSVTLQAQVAFPSAQGGYTLRWDMVQEGVTWFSGKGVRPYDQAVTIGPPPFYGGSMDVSRVPATMAPRLVTAVPLRVQNLSNFAWDANVNLSYHWYDTSGNAVVWDGLRTPLAGTQPNEVRALTASVQAPPTPGTYTLKLDIVQEGVTWFSGQGMQLAPVAVSVQVPPYGATYAAPDAASGAAGAGVVVRLAITNVGTLTWQPDAVNVAYHLYTAGGAVAVWDGQRSPLAQPVAPGQHATVDVLVMLPAALGGYTIKWDLVQEGITWFSGQSVPTGSTALTVQ